jgi:hypothetical protein
MKIQVVKTPNGTIKPAYDSDHEYFKKMPTNEVFEIEYKKQRNIKFHRKFFALIKLAYENQSDYRLMEDLRRDLLITSGNYNEVVNKITGEVFKVADSISFSNMDEVKFNEVYESVKDVIVKWLGITNENINEEINQYF